VIEDRFGARTSKYSIAIENTKVCVSEIIINKNNKILIMKEFLEK